MTAVLPQRTARPKRVVVRRRIDPDRPQPCGVRVGIRWPIGLDEAIRAELTGYLPLPVTKLIQQAEERGAVRGRLESLQRVAVNVGELDLLGEGWRERAVDTARHHRKLERDRHEQRVAAQRAQRNIDNGRHPDWQYRGRAGGGSGRVCWETGYPVETANLWLNRPRWMPLPTTTARWIPAPPVEQLATVTELRPRQSSGREAA